MTELQRSNDRKYEIYVSAALWELIRSRVLDAVSAGQVWSGAVLGSGHRSDRPSRETDHPPSRRATRDPARPAPPQNADYERK